MLQTMRSSAKYIFWFIAIAFVGGFLLGQTSGLLGRAPVTTTTVVARVNGEDILYQQYLAAEQRAVQQEEQRTGHALTLDERQRVADRAFDNMVADILLAQEYRKRGITVSDDEIIEMAQYSPPQDLMQSPELQTEGRFDPEKYRRFLASPVAKQQGLLAGLENYYRNEIPRQKLFAQIAADVYVPDLRLWYAYRDTHDSAQVSFVAFDGTRVADAGITVTDAEIQAYYDAHKKSFDRPGRAVVSVVRIPRLITAADSAIARQRILGLRNEIAMGGKFEDVAKRESADSGSAVNGGDLGKGAKGRFVKEFEDAAYALKTGELSQPVLTPFGYHLIRVDSRSGDTLSLRHLLVRITQSDSSAALTDRRADSLANMAANQESGKKFDEAARALGLPVQQFVALEGDPLMDNTGKYVPNVSAWAFQGAKAGETSELFDAEDAYILARLDSIVAGGQQTVAQAREEIVREVKLQKKLAQLVPQAQALSTAAASSTLEAAAQAKSMPVEKSAPFTRLANVPGLGRLNEAVGAAFTLPIGQVSGPVQTKNGVFVLRVDRRVPADSAAWVAQKEVQRQQLSQGLRQQRVQEYLDNLRKAAKVDDRRKDIQAAARRSAT